MNNITYTKCFKINCILCNII